MEITIVVLVFLLAILLIGVSTGRLRPNDLDLSAFRSSNAGETPTPSDQTVPLGRTQTAQAVTAQAQNQSISLPPSPTLQQTLTQTMQAALDAQASQTQVVANITATELAIIQGTDVANNAQTAVQETAMARSVQQTQMAMTQTAAVTLTAQAATQSQSTAHAQSTQLAFASQLAASASANNDIANTQTATAQITVTVENPAPVDSVTPEPVSPAPFTFTIPECGIWTVSSRLASSENRQARVDAVNGLRVREQAFIPQDRTENVIIDVFSSSIVTLLEEQPICDGGYLWWKVSINQFGEEFEGWAVEGGIDASGAADYFLTPVQ